MPEHISNSLEGQEVPLTGTDARRKAVALALMHCDFPHAHESELNGRKSGFYEMADAAIDAFLEALEQMELPEEAIEAGAAEDEILVGAEIFRRQRMQPVFRAICAALCSPKTGEVK